MSYLDTTAAPDLDQVKAVALGQRRLLLGLVGGIFANVLIRVGPESTAVSLLMAVVALTIVVYQIYWVYQLCRALGTTPWIYAIAMIIPVIGLLCLLVLNQRATVFLKAHGVRVGFLGAKA